MLFAQQLNCFNFNPLKFALTKLLRDRLILRNYNLNVENLGLSVSDNFLIIVIRYSYQHLYFLSTKESYNSFFLDKKHSATLYIIIV